MPDAGISRPRTHNNLSVCVVNLPFFSRQSRDKGQCQGDGGGGLLSPLAQLAKAKDEGREIRGQIERGWGSPGSRRTRSKCKPANG